MENKNIEKEAQKKWYQTTWGIILLLIVFIPAGLYFLWKSDFSKREKLLWTIIIGMIFLYSFDKAPQNQSIQYQSEETQQLQEPLKANQEEKNEDTKEEIYGTGQMKVGKDIPAGEYVAIGDGYVELAPDSSGNLMNIITNENVINRYYITIHDGEYLKIKGNLKLYEAENAPKVDLSKEILSAGQYKVGVDLPEGEYVVQSKGNGYVEVAKSSRGDILHNELMKADDRMYVTVKNGQYLKIRRAELKLK